jgi:hypothetical protein
VQDQSQELQTDMPWLAKLHELLFPAPLEEDLRTDRSAYERFALPYTFKPRLSVAEAILAVFVALLRIFLGCLLFAVWGTYTFLACSKMQSSLGRTAVLLPMILLFLLSLALLMIGISALARVVSPRHA